jgi:hypothetical protein
MIRNERFNTDGVCIAADVFDFNTRVYTREELGVVVATRPMTDEEIRQYGPQPLDPTGALATLLAVVGTLTVTDAANAVGLTPDDLVTEAQAWAAAGDAG